MEIYVYAEVFVYLNTNAIMLAKAQLLVNNAVMSKLPYYKLPI